MSPEIPLIIASRAQIITKKEGGIKPPIWRRVWDSNPRGVQPQTVFKTALVDFLTDDFAFEIVHKSTWHLNTILIFIEKNTPNYTNGEDF